MCERPDCERCEERSPYGSQVARDYGREQLAKARALLEKTTQDGLAKRKAS